MASNNKKQVDAFLVTALAKGATVAQAGLQAGVSERTVYRRHVDTVLGTALAKGATVAQAAQQAGVSERTAYRRLQQPEFQKRIDAVQDDMIQRAAAVLTTAAQEGIHSLVALQDPSTPPAVRRGAARDILEMGLRLREAANLEKRLLALENRSLSEPSFQAGPTRPATIAKRRPRGEAPLLQALACGATVAQAASKASLSERTVYRRLEDPAFHQRIESARADMVKRAAALLIAAALLATKSLIDLQASTTPAAVRRGAARDIIELGQKLRQATVLEKRLAALERERIPLAA
jgi:DNA-binding phage protein